MARLWQFLTHRLMRLVYKVALVAAVAAWIAYRMFLAPIPVEAVKVQPGDIVAEVMGTGTLEPRVQASISSRISGRLSEIKVDQGDRVTKNQLLATLDDGDLRQQVEVSKAQLAATQASRDRAIADIARAQAVADQAKQDMDRLIEVKKHGVVTQQEFDGSIARQKIADSELNRAAAAKIEVEKQIVLAQQTLRYQEEKLADTQITCPFDGLVIRRSREPGDVVVPGGEIVQLVSTTELWVSAWVDESAIGSIKAQQPARVVFRASTDKTVTGSVIRMAPQTDRETREFLVDVGVTQLPQYWALGQRAEVFIQTAQKQNVTTIPLRTVLWNQGQPGVFINDAGQARWRHITLGLRGRTLVEVLTGLTPNDIIVVPPTGQTLRDGRAIRLP